MDATIDPGDERDVETNDETGIGADVDPPTRPAPRNSLRDPSLLFAIGPLAAFLIGAGLVSSRDEIGATNVALLLALVVVVAATADRAAGLATALVAAISYNFFHTEPYRSLRIDDGVDMLTVALLIVVGLVVSEISARGRAASRVSHRLGDAERALERSAELLAGGADATEMWTTIRTDLIELLHITDCRFEPAGDALRPVSELPLMSRAGTLGGQQRRWVASGFELPSSGAAIPVTHAGVDLGQIVLIPRPGSGSVRDERRLAVALADQFGTSIAGSRTPPDPAPTSESDRPTKI